MAETADVGVEGVSSVEVQGFVAWITSAVAFGENAFVICRARGLGLPLKAKVFTLP
jgi:hypothetical protein